MSSPTNSTPVKRNRVGNVDTDRLLGRQGHLVVMLRHVEQDNRHPHVMRAAELMAVEDELDRRGLVTVRRSARLSHRGRNPSVYSRQ
jgi:hypothetical protein